MNSNDVESSDAESAALARWIKWVNWTPYLTGGFLAVLVAAYVIAFVQNGWSKNPEAWGQLGDYIGGLLNPLVAGFALMALVVSVRLQKAELAATRKELENSRLAMQEQATTAEQQRQEQRFFDLLNIYQQTVSSISIVARMSPSAELPVHYSGKEAIAQFFRSDAGGDVIGFDSEGFGYWSQSLERPFSEHINGKADLQNLWNSGQIPSLFDHYFRVVFRVLCESNDLLGVQHHRYVKLFRAQLSRNELSLLGFNIWLDEEGQKMIPLAAKYGLLKHLSKGHLRTQLEKELSPEVFGRKFAKSQASLNSSEAAPC
jgi:hypothetical protein